MPWGTTDGVWKGKFNHLCCLYIGMDFSLVRGLRVAVSVTVNFSFRVHFFRHGNGLVQVLGVSG